MADSNWKGRYWLNTASGYVSVATKMVVSLLSFRLLWTSLSPEDLGFWQFTWSLMAYTLFLDLGFGFVLQRDTAKHTALDEHDRLTSLISTIFWAFAGIATIAGIVAYACSDLILHAVKVKPEQYDEYLHTFHVFVICVAVLFPFGIFPEILRGLHRIDIYNWASVGGSIAGYVALYILLDRSASLSTMMIALASIHAVTYLIAMVMSWRLLPTFSLAWRHVDFRSLIPLLGLSFSTYFITCCNVVMSNSDILLLGVLQGLAVIPVYQAGFKVSQLITQFVRQLNSMQASVSSTLKAKEDMDGLRHFFTTSSQLTITLVLPCAILGLVYMDELITVFTDDPNVSPLSRSVGYTLIASATMGACWGNPGTNMLLACGLEKRLMVLTVVQTILNLVASIVCFYLFGPIGIAIGTLFAVLVCRSLGVTWICKNFLSFNIRQLTTDLMLPGLLPIALCGLLTWLITTFVPISPDENLFLGLAWRGLIALLPVAALARKQFRAIVA